MIEEYKGYTLESRQKRVRKEKWSVNVQISNENSVNTFFSNDGILYILEIEAALESINLGKNLIDRNLVGF